RSPPPRAPRPFLPAYSYSSCVPPVPHSFPTRRSSDLGRPVVLVHGYSDSHEGFRVWRNLLAGDFDVRIASYESLSNEISIKDIRSEEHTSELQSRENLVCRLLLQKKNALGL